jgi:hypothetical protein
LNPVGAAPCVARMPPGATATASVGDPVVVVGNIGDDGSSKGVAGVVVVVVVVVVGAAGAGAIGSRATGDGAVEIGFADGLVARVVDDAGNAVRVIDGRGAVPVQLGG